MPASLIPWPRALGIGWGTVAVLAVLIGVVVLRLLSSNPEAVTEEPFVLLVK